MKVIRNAAAAAVIAAFAALSASAQQPAANRPATSAPAQTAGAGAAVPDAKVAIINSDAFSDQKVGVQRLIAAFNTLEREFKPRRDEIQALKTKYDNLAKQINDTRAVANQSSLAQLADQAETLEKDMKRKQEDGQAAFQKRYQELTNPVLLDLENALESYAKQRNISVVFDVSKMAGAMMVVNNAVDITADFIADYNRRNPASTAAAAPANR
ncbi:MAG TPA: OmpH family outer membrane protein [Pyrinomonadaceae bacterium]|nr:OmpH family outer membrane protein [Pyrinomonadaceae bacterium]